jgi:hypothetical protein
MLFTQKIISPHDKGISNSILVNLKPQDSSWNVDVLESNPLVSDPLDEVLESYLRDIQELSFNRYVN